MEKAALKQVIEDLNKQVTILNATSCLDRWVQQRVWVVFVPLGFIA
jgi:hypothetical protein